MIPDAATTSTPAPQAVAPANPASAPAGSASATGAAPGPQPAPASPAPQPTPVQLLWEVAHLAFGLMTRLVHVLQPIQQYYPKQALLLARLLIDIPRIILTIRYAPERVTLAQFRHLTRARHLLQALFNYTLPTLGTPISRLASAAPVSQSPSASPENATSLGPRTSSSATTPSPAVPTVPSPNSPSSTTPGVRTPTIREVPEIPMVAGVSQVPASPTVDHNPSTPDPSHPSHDSHTSPTSHSAFPDPQSVNPQSAIHNPHSSFSPFVPDVHTLLQALKADSLLPNCAGALFEDPGDALVLALHQLHTIYFSLYPHQPPSPSQSSINPQSNIPQSASPSVNPVNQVSPVNPVHSAHSPSPAQSAIHNLQSGIPSEKAQCAFEAEFHIPHSSAPP